MLNAAVLTFQEFVMHEPLPLATLHGAVLEFLRHRDDTVLFAAQAVNAYVPEPRMSQGVDILCLRAAEVAQELRAYLQKRFHLAIRVRDIGKGRGFRIYHVRKPKNRHLVDVRAVDALPSTLRIDRVLVMAPAALVAYKVISYHQRRGKPKAGTDWRDVAELLLKFPDLKHETAPVYDCLQAAGACEDILDVWRGIVVQEILPEDEDIEW